MGEVCGHTKFILPISVKARYIFFFSICMCVVRGSRLRARVAINLLHINVTVWTVHSTRDIPHYSRQVENLFKPPDHFIYNFNAKKVGTLFNM